MNTPPKPDNCTCPIHQDRRRILRYALAAGGLLWLPADAHASTIKRLEGMVAINGRKALPDTPVRPGDVIETGEDGRIAFVVGKDAYLLRSNTRLKLEADTDNNALIGSLRVFTGALIAAFGRGRRRQIVTPTLTAGIRGTGIYLEASAEESYFCLCYGEVDIGQPGGPTSLFTAGHHAGKRSTLQGIQDAPMINHSDVENIFVESLVGRKPDFFR